MSSSEESTVRILLMIEMSQERGTRASEFVILQKLGQMII
jgi:hypothetical protein